MQGFAMHKIFLSHKHEHDAAANDWADALSLVVRKDEIFLSEEMDKADDWRTEIERALAQSKCFLLLYTGPKLDWSWCFYEAGRFAAVRSKAKRPIYCLHPPDVKPPSPLANLQTIDAEPHDLESWIRNSLCSVLKCR